MFLSCRRLSSTPSQANLIPGFRRAVRLGVARGRETNSA
jgi:hypothetical protein